MTDKEIKEASALTQLAAGIEATAVAQPVQYSLAPAAPQDSCPVPEATKSTTINANNLFFGTQKIITLELFNESLNPADYIFGSFLAKPGYKQFFPQGASGLTSAADVLEAKCNGIGGNGGGVFISEAAIVGGLILDSVRVYDASEAQFSEGFSSVKVNLNGNAVILKERRVLRDSQLNSVELTSCDIPLSAMTGIIYKLGASEAVTMEMSVKATGLGVYDFTTKPLV